MFQDRIFIGIGGKVLALRTMDGQEIWRKKLATLAGGITTVALIGGRLYATCQGELTCLDPATGHIHWCNTLSGLGTGFIALAGADASPAAGQAASDAASAAAMVAVMAATSAATTTS